MATTPVFSFEVDGLYVLLTFGTLSGEKTFASSEGVEAARSVYDATLKAMKAKKSTASLKAELFTIFDMNKEVSVKVENTAKVEEKPKKEKVKKEEKVEASTAERTLTTRVQVGKTVTFIIDGIKYSKAIDSKEVRDSNKNLFDKIKEIEAKEKWSKTDEISIGRLKKQVKDLMLSNTIKEEKEIEVVAEKAKAIDKKLSKMKKEPTVKVVTPNKNLIEALTAEHSLSDGDVKKITDIIEKKNVEAPKPVVTSQPRRGEH